MLSLHWIDQIVDGKCETGRYLCDGDGPVAGPFDTDDEAVAWRSKIVDRSARPKGPLVPVRARAVYDVSFSFATTGSSIIGNPVAIQQAFHDAIVVDDEAISVTPVVISLRDRINVLTPPLERRRVNDPWGFCSRAFMNGLEDEYGDLIADKE